MDKNICEVCGTENEEEYKFCKNCGTSFNKTTNESQNANFEETKKNSYNTVNPNMNNSYDSNPSGDMNFNFTNKGANAVSNIEMAAFIGKKANNILPKFTKMEITHSKVSWCWPAAVLGYFFGPMGSAIWFFYRKMYKTAIIFSVIGILVSIIVSVLTFGYMDQAYDAFYEAFASSGLKGGFQSIMDSVPEDTYLTLIGNTIENVANIAACVIAGVFGFNWYKNHCINKIISFRNEQSDPRFYQMGLSAVGGTSGGMLAVGIILIIAVNNIESVISSLAAMI